MMACSTPISAWGTTEELWFNNWEFKGTPYTTATCTRSGPRSNSAKNFKTPTLVIHGQRDYRLDVSEGFQLFTTLQTDGRAVEDAVFSRRRPLGAEAAESQLWYKTVNDWVDQWTK